MYIPMEWAHFRAIDYHESTNWAIVFMSLSHNDELFVWDELNPSPEKNTTAVIAELIAEKSRDYTFQLNLIDPLASKIQTNTGLGVIDDLNRLFHTFKKEGLCTGGLWESWDTKSTRGRDKIRERLINAAKVDKPFHNEVVRDGVRIKLPTLWIFNTCKHTARSLQQWRLDGEKPAQEWSHFCTAIEGVLKDVRFRPKQNSIPQYKDKHLSYFTRR